MSIKEKIYNNSPKFAVSTWKYIKKQYLSRVAKSYPIVLDPENKFEVLYKIKDSTWEDTYYPECYGHCKEQHLQVFSPARYVFKTNNAIVTYESDAVITSEGVYWDKYNDQEFITWASPCDSNVFKYDRNNIYLIRNKRQVSILGRTLSLIGVWAFHWAHCMYQFVPKLFTAGEAELLNEPINILVTKEEDSVILEIMNGYLKNFPNAKILYAEKDTDYICEELIFMPAFGSTFNDHKFRLDYPFYIDKYALDIVKKYVINPVVEQIKDNPVVYEKIYLPRGIYRSLNNTNEVHEYFKKIGFVDIEGSKLTFIEKANIFYHAKEVVAPYGSALLNLMFCNNANCMVFINYKMSTDTSLYLQIRNYVKTLINVTGQDNSSDYHTGYYIPLEKIKKAYEEYIKQ